MFEVRFYSGGYRARQEAANKDGAVFYGEGHANASTSTSADYALCVCSRNASSTSIGVAQRLAEAWGEAMDVGGDRDHDIGYGNGVRIGGAGDYNLRYTEMPAVLFEPVFASNPEQAALAETDEGLDTVARILADEIRKTFPAGGLVAFSVGHVGKPSAPRDRGAAWAGERFQDEAAYAEAYLRRAAELLMQNESLVNLPEAATYDLRGGPLEVVTGGASSFWITDDLNRG